MRYNFYILISSFLIFSCENAPEVKEVSIIPQPVDLIYGQEFFELDDETVLSFDNKSLKHQELLKSYLKDISGFEFGNGNSETKSIQCEITAKSSNQYRLSINTHRILLSAGSDQALLQGFQTLRQIFYQSHNHSIPTMEIIDSAAFEWRGLLLDCSRHFMEKDFVKRYIDLLALYKMNVLHWHLTEDQGWRIQIDKYPKLTEIGAWRDDGNGGKYGGFYTKEDIREVVAYASKRGIRVVPEIELPGHSLAALAAYPHLSCTGGPFEVETEWGVFKDIYCAGNDSTFAFLEDVLTEVINLFPSEYIHIGGDEAPKYRWENCAKCQERMKDENLEDEHALQSYFINRIGKFLASKGKKMIGWDEILEGGIPDGAIVQSWRSFKGAREATQQGHQAIVSPTSHAYFDYGLNDIDMEKVYAFNPIPTGLSDAEKKLILGGECNMWSERAPQDKVDSKIFPRILAMAEVLWANKKTRDYEEFKTRVAAHYSILDKLGVKYGFETVPVKVSTSLENDVLMAKLISYDSTLDIYYHDEKGSQLYSESIPITNPANWKVTISRNQRDYQDTLLQAFWPHYANFIEAEIEYPYEKNYTGGGVIGLTDGKKGSFNFRDGNWQGYWGTDVIASVDLGEIKSLQRFSSGFLQYNNAWIFFPLEVEYEISEDGEHYRPIGVIQNSDTPQNKEQKTQEYTLMLDKPVMARYVRMKAKNMGVCPDWHDAAGSKAWLFIDEFSLN